jgi:conjugative transfer signal peptidase TraF
MKRITWFITTSAAVVAVSATGAFHPTPRLIWNATASTPIGLYVLQQATSLNVGDLVTVRPPEPIASFLTEGGFLPKGVPLLKHVLALPGQSVCRSGLAIAVDGMTVGEARARDNHGRDLPIWDGCRQLASDELFLMNPSIADSLDGRYFGPLPRSSVFGRATPLWTEGDAR